MKSHIHHINISYIQKTSILESRINDAHILDDHFDLILLLDFDADIEKINTNGTSVY